MFKIEGIGDIFKEVVKEGGLFARLFGKGLLRGRVVDSDGTPLEGVTITIGEKLSQNTSYKGTFLFAKVKGRYEITVQHKDFRIEKFDYVFVKGGQEIEIEVELDSSSRYNSISDSSVETHLPH